MSTGTTTPKKSPAPLGGPSQFLGPDRNWHLTFGILLFVTLGLFLRWALEYTGHDSSTPLLILAVCFGVFMAFTIGGNDVANSFGTSVGAGTLTIKQALLVAAVFEVSGAVIAGGEVTDTIRGGIVDLSVVEVSPQDFIFIMMAALAAAAFWLLFATNRGYPVSTTHSIIGGIVGASLTLGFVTAQASPFAMVQWDQIGQIAISWVLSPVLGGLVSYLLYRTIKQNVLDYNARADEALRAIKAERRQHRDQHKAAFERLSEIQQISYTSALARDAAVLRRGDHEPDELESDYFRELEQIEAKADDVGAHKALESWVPILAALGAMIISAMLLFKGLKNMDLGLTTMNNYLIMGMVGASVWMATFIFAKTLKRESLSRSTFLLFSWMQVFTASGFAFSHGSNDIANAIGPFAAILDVLRTGAIDSEAAIPPAALLTFGVALICGLWFIGRKVIATVGHNLTTMHPASGFSAELSAAGVVMGASVLGLPVSSTHILIGAVLGIGLVNRQTNWGLMRPIALAWVITLPAAATLGAVGMIVLRSIF
ncbi:inorganic phosphate transporter [Janibacter sp. GXQ6167]|uniref:inorganic phosphate transporter n=1 Tax=Janibacter sp. GXQ6167 TaxID=3240791 RepID=UPI003523F1B2